MVAVRWAGGCRYPPARGEVKHLRGKPTEDERSLSPGMEMSELGLPVTGDPPAPAGTW